MATENLMADFLREIRDVSVLSHRRERRRKRDAAKAAETSHHGRLRETESDDNLPDITVIHTEKGGAFIPDHDGASSFADGESTHQSLSTYDEQDLGGEALEACR